MDETGLILEGGGTRGVFTAGVLDYFMEQDCYLPYVIGVSAGACNAVNYVAKQKGRTKECMIDYLYQDNYLGFRNMLKKRCFFDMDLIFERFPNDLIPFDYEEFFSSKQRCMLTTTNCITGDVTFIEEKEDRDRLMSACRASSSLPYVSPIVMLDDIPMLDGGLADSIPIRKAFLDGYQKNVIILTRMKGYRKPVSKKKKHIAKYLYLKYPKLYKTILSRNENYNQTLDYIDRLEESGKVFVIRPQRKPVDRAESRPDILNQFYQHGYEYAKEIFGEMKQFMEGTPNESREIG